MSHTPKEEYYPQEEKTVIISCEINSDDVSLMEQFLKRINAKSIQIEEICDEEEKGKGNKTLFRDFMQKKNIK